MSRWMDFLLEQLHRCRTKDDFDALANVVQTVALQGLITDAERVLWKQERERYERLRLPEVTRA